jgi:hypothetical protein
MATKAADDYPYISRRLAEIEGRAAVLSHCHTCDDAGWVPVDGLLMYQDYEVCPWCENPRGRPKP